MLFFLLGILPVVDSFELAFANKKSWEKVDVSWRKGVEYIYSQLLKVFEENGLKQVIPLGEIFDPIFHDSVESIDVKNSSEGGKILEVLQNGYSMNNKVVRPARVKVAIYKKE